MVEIIERLLLMKEKVIMFLDCAEFGEIMKSLVPK